MPTLNRRLADQLAASAVVAEDIVCTLPVCGWTVRARVLPHLEVVRVTSSAMVADLGLLDANRADRRALGDLRPVEEVKADQGDGLFRGMLNLLARALIDDDGNRVFHGANDLVETLRGMHNDDQDAMLALAGELAAGSSLARPADDTDEALVVGKGSSRSGRTSSRSTTHASSSAASPPSSA